jgi:hypothetical protein
MRVATGPETSERFARLSKVDIADIVENGAKASFWRKNTPKHYEQLLRRLQQSCYLDRADAPLTAQQRLIDQYRRDGLVLFLGAGVSRGTSDCRIPNWEGLSELMLEEVHAPAPEKLDPNDPCRVKKLLKRFDRVHECLPLDRREFWFLEKLYRCLYANFDQTVRALLRSIPKKREAQKGWPDWDKCRDALARNMSLAAVGDLLIIGDEDQWRRNANIHAVLTVNADNLLELYCRAKARGRRLVTQVDRASVGDHPYAISVYHLHGTLDIRCENFSTRCSWWNDDLLPDVVFRTSEYEETERCPFSFVNHTPLSYLQRLNILFLAPRSTIRTLFGGSASPTTSASSTGRNICENCIATNMAQRDQKRNGRPFGTSGYATRQKAADTGHKPRWKRWSGRSGNLASRSSGVRIMVSIAFGS